jgi:hypothetical protein
MSEDRFWDQLHEDAGGLRYEPHDEAIWTRLPAKIRERVRSQVSVTQTLARWARPITASFVTLALVAAVSVTWIERSHESTYAVEALASNSVEITLDGDTFSLAAE